VYFFAFLTFYSAYFNKVTDCGCFGDAIKFTPWQSFFKDIILLFGLLILWLFYRNSKATKRGSLQNTAFVVSVLGSVFIIAYGIIREPLIDFRDYKKGTLMNEERQKIAQNPAQYKVYYELENTTTKEIKSVDEDEFINNKEYWQEGTPWKIVEGKTESKLVKEGYRSEIVKFKLEDAQGNDISEEVLQAPKAVILFSYNPKDVDSQSLIQMETQLKKLPETYILGVSPEKDTFKFIRGASMDGTAIKTIARSNPFVLILEKGKIVDKQPASLYLKNKS